MHSRAFPSFNLYRRLIANREEKNQFVNILLWILFYAYLINVMSIEKKHEISASPEQLFDTVNFQRRIDYECKNDALRTQSDHSIFHWSMIAIFNVGL